MADDDDEVLGDHRWRRTTLVPPLVDSVGGSMQMVRWARERMPDFLWIALMYDTVGGKRTVDIAIACAEEAQEIHDGGDFVLSSDYDELSSSEFSSLKEALDDDILEDLFQGLEPLIAYYPSYPKSSLFDETPPEEDHHLGYLAEIVDDLSDRRSQLSTYVQGIFVGTLMATGGMMISPDSPLADINEVFRYPETEKSRELASVVRASTKATNASNEGDENQSDWARRFWQRGFKITECIFPQEDQDAEEQGTHPDQEFFQNLAAIGHEYETDLRTTLLDLWWDAKHDAEFTGKHEVLDGLLLRQVNLATSLAGTPTMWSNDIGSIILRCMSETHIMLEWLNQEGDRSDYQDFIEYGLGQEKLLLEHSKNVASDFPDEEVGDLEQGLDDLEQKIETQRAMYLLPVDVGHWADKNTRELAQEAGCKDVYDMRFQQHSAAVHSQWNAIDKANLVTCHNPLHQYHKIPEFRPVYKNPYAVVEAGNLMNRSFSSWIEAREIDTEDPQIPDLAGSVKQFMREWNDG